MATFTSAVRPNLPINLSFHRATTPLATSPAMTSDISLFSDLGRNPPLTSNPLEQVDMVCNIVAYLYPGDLKRCLSVSKTFFQAAEPLTYRQVRIVSNPRPIDRMLSSGAGHAVGPSNAAAAARISRYAVAVDISRHSSADCTPAYDLPRLRTVIYDLDLDARALADHPCSYSRPVARCVLRLDPWWALHGRILDTLAPSDEVIVHFHAWEVSYFWPLLGLPLRADAVAGQAPTRPRLTLVFFPPAWDVPLGQAVHSSFFSATAAFEQVPIFNIVEQLAREERTPLRVFGLEDANPFASDDEWRQRHDRAIVAEAGFRRALEARLVDYCHPPEEIKLRQELVTIGTLVEYLESCEWEDELHWASVGRWLNTCHAREMAVG